LRDLVFKNAVMVVVVAACRHPGSLQLLDSSFESQSPIRRGGTATALSHLVPLWAAPPELLDLLVALFDDPDDVIAREAGTALLNVPDDGLDMARRLIPAASRSRTFTLSAGPAIRCLERFAEHMPNAVLQTAARFFAIYGHEAADIRTASVHDASVLIKLVVGAYATNVRDEAVSVLALDIIDQGVLVGTWGIDEHLTLLDR